MLTEARKSSEKQGEAESKLGVSEEDVEKLRKTPRNTPITTLGFCLSHRHYFFFGPVSKPRYASPSHASTRDVHHT